MDSFRWTPKQVPVIHMNYKHRWKDVKLTSIWSAEMDSWLSKPDDFLQK